MEVKLENDDCNSVIGVDYTSRRDGHSLPSVAALWRLTMDMKVFQQNIIKCHNSITVSS